MLCSSSAAQIEPQRLFEDQHLPSTGATGQDGEKRNVPSVNTHFPIYFILFQNPFLAPAETHNEKKGQRCHMSAASVACFRSKLNDCPASSLYAVHLPYPDLQRAASCKRAFSTT